MSAPAAAGMHPSASASLPKPGEFRGPTSAQVGDTFTRAYQLMKAGCGDVASQARAAVLEVVDAQRLSFLHGVARTGGADSSAGDSRGDGARGDESPFMDPSLVPKELDFRGRKRRR